MSTTTLAPSVSGPQHQTLRASFSGQSNFSRYNLARSLASAFGPAGPASIALLSSSSNGSAVTYMRLCLLGDFDKHVWFDVPETVSRYETTGSDLESFFNPSPNLGRSLPSF